MALHVLGMGGRRVTRKPWQPISGGYDILAVAPFIGSTALDTVAGMGCGKRILVSKVGRLSLFDRRTNNKIALR